MIVVTVILVGLLILSYILDIVYINSNSFRSKFESSKLVTILSANAIKALESGSSNPTVTYISKRIFGLVALIMCLSFIYFLVFYI